MKDLVDYRQLPWRDLVALTHNAASRIRQASSDDDAIALARSALASLDEMARRSEQAGNLVPEFAVRTAVLCRATNLDPDLSLERLLVRFEKYLLPIAYDFGPISESNRDDLWKARQMKNLMKACRPIESTLSESDKRIAYWYNHFDELP